MIDDRQQLTVLLHAWRGGDRAAGDRLSGIVYEELRRMARRRLSTERGDHTLQPTALVHEAYERLVQGEPAWRDRAHFFATAALHMRAILVDHARARGSDKRGGGALRVTLHEDLSDTRLTPGTQVLMLDEALRRLEHEDERTARVIELTYFGGLTREEIAGVLALSVPTVDRALRFGRAWLKHALAE